MSGAQYLRQLLAPLGVYDLEGPFQNGELEALGEALDQAEAALDELHRESCLATAQDWGLERTASLFRRRPIAATPKAMREALAALLPAHLLVQYHFWYLTWAQLESKFSCWQEIEDKALTWTGLETYVEPEDGSG